MTEEQRRDFIVGHHNYWIPSQGLGPTSKREDHRDTPTSAAPIIPSPRSIPAHPYRRERPHRHAERQREQLPTSYIGGGVSTLGPMSSNGSENRKWSRADAAHPAGSNAELFRRLPRILPPVSKIRGPVLFQSAEMGALPTLRAATDPTVQGGQNYGAEDLAEQRGHPKLVRSGAQSHDEDLQKRLWAVSAEFTGISFAV